LDQNSFNWEIEEIEEAPIHFSTMTLERLYFQLQLIVEKMRDWEIEEVL